MSLNSSHEHKNVEQLWVGGNDHIVNSNVFKYKVMIKITLNEAKRKLINRYKILMRRIKKISLGDLNKMLSLETNEVNNIENNRFISLVRL